MRLNWKRWLKSKNYWEITDGENYVTVFRDNTKIADFDDNELPRANPLVQVLYNIDYKEFHEARELVQMANYLCGDQRYKIIYGK